MPTIVIAFIVIGMAFALSFTKASANSTNANPLAIEKQQPSLHQSNTTIRASQATTSAPESQVIDNKEDCDGYRPSTGSVTALLRKIVHTSSTPRGVQCPIPPVPDHSTTQEPHP
jgi:muramidase (phage lysozyme)